jgi:hypothetical protein
MTGMSLVVWLAILDITETISWTIAVYVLNIPLPRHWHKLPVRLVLPVVKAGCISKCVDRVPPVIWHNVFAAAVSVAMVCSAVLVLLVRMIIHAVTVPLIVAKAVMLGTIRLDWGALLVYPVWLVSTPLRWAHPLLARVKSVWMLVMLYSIIHRCLLGRRLVVSVYYHHGVTIRLILFVAGVVQWDTITLLWDRATKCGIFPIVECVQCVITGTLPTAL